MVDENAQTYRYGSYLNLTPSSHYKFTKNCIAAPGEN